MGCPSQPNSGSSGSAPRNRPTCWSRRRGHSPPRRLPGALGSSLAPTMPREQRQCSGGTSTGPSPTPPKLGCPQTASWAGAMRDSEADGPPKGCTVKALGWEMLAGGWEMVGGWELLGWQILGWGVVVGWGTVGVGNGWGEGIWGGNSWGAGIFLRLEMKWLYSDVVGVGIWGVGNCWGEKWLPWEMVGIKNDWTP